MPHKGRLIAFRLDEAVMARLEADRARFGTPVSEQVRRAIEAWLEAGGVAGATAPRGGTGQKQTARTRVAPRTRA